MKNLLIAAMMLLLSACATAIPQPGENSALVIFSSDPASTLVASKVNGRAVEQGHYFKVSPGHNTLEVLVVANLGSGQESTMHKFASIDFSEFTSAATYRINLAERGANKALQLFDDEGNLLGERII